MSRASLAAALAAAALLASPARAQFPADLRADLDAAVELYRTTRAEQFRLATDPNERYEILVGPPIFGFGDAAYLFAIGDEAFEAEIDRQGGLGSGEAWGPPPLPAVDRRLHDGERGGLDASSCRSCHFVGGPDGGGAPSQVGLFRGDGRRLSSAIVRDAPHIMGVGYIELLARQIERAIAARVDIARFQAADIGAPIAADLEIDGVDFGVVLAAPDGSLDTRGVRGISPDLVVRPFGHKGRHATLVALADEALQVHHGLQSQSRVDTHRDDPATWLGDGGEFDPDGDGVQSEATEAQAVLLASYMSMLGVPRIEPPADAALALAWSRGRAHFAEVGCADCHRPVLRLEQRTITHIARGESDLRFTLDLAEAGQEPIPRQLDFSPDADDLVRVGTPIHAFTDLRRHDLGPALAEPRPEVLPDGGGEVPGSVWLTRSLWGLADTGPYLHDGRAPTVRDAIALHGGDAAASRAAFDALGPRRQGELLLFLASLTRAPTLLVE